MEIIKCIAAVAAGALILFWVYLILTDIAWLIIGIPVAALLIDPMSA